MYKFKYSNFTAKKNVLLLASYDLENYLNIGLVIWIFKFNGKNLIPLKNLHWKIKEVEHENIFDWNYGTQ